MRHRKRTVKLNRSSAHRRAMFSNLVGSLILHEKVVTTLPKAKAARPLAERMITLAKRGTLAARRRALSLLRNRAVVAKLFAELGPRFGDRAGGYTRIVKLAVPRRGDSAASAILMFVEGEEKKPAREKEKKAEKQPPPEAKPSAEEKQG